MDLIVKQREGNQDDNRRYTVSSIGNARLMIPSTDIIDMAKLNSVVAITTVR